MRGGADGAGNEVLRVQSTTVVHFGPSVEIPEASRFLPGARAGHALLFERIQRRENATDRPGRRHPGAFDSGSQRSSEGHRSPGAAREEGRKNMELSSGRPVDLLVLEAERGAVPWISGSAVSPSPGRSCEHVDDENGTRGRKGERRVFARSGLNALMVFYVILFLALERGPK